MYERTYAMWILVLEVSMRFCAKKVSSQLLGRLKRSWVGSNREVLVSLEKDLGRLKKSPKSKEGDKKILELCFEISDLLSRYPPDFDRLTEKFERLNKMTEK